jgi:hypothetical protein
VLKIMLVRTSAELSCAFSPDKRPFPRVKTLFGDNGPSTPGQGVYGFTLAFSTKPIRLPGTLPPLRSVRWKSATSMDIEPKSIHQRTPLIIGSRTEVAEFQQIHSADAATHSFGEAARSESPIS